jgi:hypothetical protein
MCNFFMEYCLVCKSNHPFLVLKRVTEMSFLVLKRISENSEEDQYFILPNRSLVIIYRIFLYIPGEPKKCYHLLNLNLEKW